MCKSEHAQGLKCVGPVFFVCHRMQGKGPQVKEGKAAVWVLWNNLSMSEPQSKIRGVGIWC